MVATRRLNQLADSVREVADFPPGPLVVALSGGADSAACAWLAGSYGPTRALHVHHGLAASDLMEEAARAIASTLDLSLDVLRIEVEPWSEGKARERRYAALIGGLGAGEWLLTAHTADDQAETVFAHLLRGAGLEGLAGIPARRPPVARPLLAIDRSTTRELATLAGLPWRDDPNNVDLGPLRNRLRLRLIPQIEADYNLGFRRHLVELATTAAALDAGPLVGPIVADGEVRLPLPMLAAVEPKVAIRSVREAVRPLRGGYSLTRAETDRIWKVVLGSMHSTELTGGITVTTTGPWLCLAAAGSELAAPVEWRIPGSVMWGGFRLDAVVTRTRPLVMPLSPWQVVLDLDRVGEELTVRGGPRGTPELLAGTKLVWEVGRNAHASGWVDHTTRRYLSALCVEQTSLP